MQPRVFWDVVEGWVVETPFALTASQVAAVVQFTLKVQVPRAKLKHGDAREQAMNALKQLSPSTLKQRVVAKPGAERVLYAKD